MVDMESTSMEVQNYVMAREAVRVSRAALNAYVWAHGQLNDAPFCRALIAQLQEDMEWEHGAYLDTIGVPR